MSFHELEDFVENAILLVNQSQFSHLEKRNLAASLYGFQQAHDTSYTHFRVYDILKDIHYLYEWPLNRHPDFPTHPGYFSELDSKENAWIKEDLHTEDSGSIYMREKGGEKFLYFDAGDTFWNRVKDQLPEIDRQAPQFHPLPQVFFSLLREAERLQDNAFISQCYAVWVNSILEFYLDEQDGIPTNFSDWLGDEILLGIRKFAEKHQTTFEYQEEEEDFLSLPDYALEKELATNIEEEGKLAFLLDFENSLTELAQIYHQDRAAKAEPEQFERVYTFFRAKLDNSWRDGIFQVYNDDHEYTFLKELREEREGQEAVYACLIFQVDPNMKIVVCKIGIQNGLMLQWQNRGPMASPENQHFVQDIALYLEEDEMEHNEFISIYGGWKYDMRKSDTWLTACLENLWQFYEKYSPYVYTFFSQPLLNWTERNVEELMEERTKALSKGFNFFGNEMDFKLALARLNQHKGNLEELARYIAQVEDLQAQGLGSAGLQKRISQGLENIKSNTVHYPEISQIFSPRLP
ncbi:MAG: hypothetical protein AAGA10_27065 [Bacteroidota bacterium]